MTKSYKELRDRAADDITISCYCAGPTCSGCEENTKELFCIGHDHGVFESEIVKRLVEGIRNSIARSDDYGDSYYSSPIRETIKIYEDAKREAGK